MLRFENNNKIKFHVELKNKGGILNGNTLFQC